MANKIFDSILKEKINNFIASFLSTSNELFDDEKTKRLFHAGEFGAYREAIVREFLQFIVPRGLDIYWISDHIDG